MQLKYLLVASLFILEAAAHADTVDKDGILKNAQGNVLVLTHLRAIEACANHGMRLPTIRELVKLNQSAGLIIKEPSEISEGDPIMWQVPSVDPNGTRDVFYYHKNYYVRPAGDLGSHSFWSSSLASLREERCSIIFSGFYGEVREAYHEWWINPGDSYAVRCVAGK